MESSQNFCLPVTQSVDSVQKLQKLSVHWACPGVLLNPHVVFLVPLTPFSTALQTLSPGRSPLSSRAVLSLLVAGYMPSPPHSSHATLGQLHDLCLTVWTLSSPAFQHTQLLPGQGPPVCPPLPLPRVLSMSSHASPTANTFTTHYTCYLLSAPKCPALRVRNSPLGARKASDLGHPGMHLSLSHIGCECSQTAQSSVLLKWFIITLFKN